ncbi:hypothetical protein [Priestia megaterium]|uniref:hypothetical protein n=1 Tax=Priestia megaterium TaxID=1404 RepID=UPI000CA1CF16|nr:hypothetical protein [Priestia megaterium]AUO09999.1 hypothetical protein C0569_01485 [Priestia megaterium]
MVGGKGEDSCGKSGTDETPQERKRRGGSSTARGKRSLARKSIAMEQAAPLINRNWSSLIGFLSLCSNLFLLSSFLVL